MSNQRITYWLITVTKIKRQIPYLKQRCKFNKSYYREFKIWFIFKTSSGLQLLFHQSVYSNRRGRQSEEGEGSEEEASSDRRAAEESGQRWGVGRPAEGEDGEEGAVAAGARSTGEGDWTRRRRKLVKWRSVTARVFLFVWSVFDSWFCMGRFCWNFILNNL